MRKPSASDESKIESGFCDLQSELDKIEPAFPEKAKSFTNKQERLESVVLQHPDSINQDQEIFEQEEDDFSEKQDTERGDQVPDLDQDKKLSDQEFKKLIFQELYQDVKRELSKP